MEIIVSILLGISLSAACGFRIFVPLLVMGVASRSGHIVLAPGFEWIGSIPAIVAFAVATGLEIIAYYVPWLDNLLDTVATPVAIVAGIIVMASCVSGMSPLFRWTLAVVVGGGAAGIVQGATALTRAASTATTGGLGNPLVSTAEAGGSFALSLMAIVVPALIGVVVIAVLIYAVRKIYSKMHTPPPRPCSPA